MENKDKLVENIMKIIKISGFVVSFPGDPSVGVSDGQWTINGDFYFDDQEELQKFKDDLKLTWENYCGENCRIYTCEEIDEVTKSLV